MRKTFLLFGVMMFSSFAFGQFKLTPNNFVSTENSDKDYIVLDFPEINQKDLFQKTKEYILSNFKNLKGDGMNEVEYSHIKLRTSQETPFGKMLGMLVYADLTLLIELKFKDGKVMIQPNFIEMTKVDNSKIYLTRGNSFTGKSIFNKKGEVWMEEAHSGAEYQINNFVKKLSDYINKKEDW